MQVVVPVHVSHEFVLEHPHDHVVGASKTASPCQQFGAVDAVALNRPSSHQRKRNLGTETGSKTQTVFQFGVFTTFREVEVSKLWIVLLVIGNGWNPSGLEAVKHAGVFNPDRHWVPGEALGVGNDQFVGGITKGVPERLDFGLS